MPVRARSASLSDFQKMELEILSGGATSSFLQDVRETDATSSNCIIFLVVAFIGNCFLRLELNGGSEGEGPVLRIIGEAIPGIRLIADIQPFGIGALLQRSKERYIVDGDIEAEVLQLAYEWSGVQRSLQSTVGGAPCAKGSVPHL